MEGSHSPFGIAWQVASATGWSLHHILWNINYPTLLLMSMDAPRYASRSTKQSKSKRTVKRKMSALEYFSNLTEN